MTERRRDARPLVKPVCASFTAALLAIAAAGCSSPVSTPLPNSTQSLKPVLSPADEKKAVEELNKEKVGRRAAAVKALESRQ